MLSDSVEDQWTRLVDDREDIAAVDDEVLFAVELEFCSAPLAEDDAVAGFDIEGDAGAGVGHGAVAYGEDGGELWFFGGGFWEVDACGGLGFCGVAFYEDFIVEWADGDFGFCFGCHGVLSF